MTRRRIHRWLPAALFAVSLTTHFLRLLSSPPGLWGDAARLGIHTVDFLRRNLWPFYVYHMFAPNPLINYLQAPAFVIFGINRGAVRGVTAFAGALAAPAVYAAGREIFDGRGAAFGRKAGALAALGMALSPHLTLYTHEGTENFLLSLLELMVVAALWRGWRRGRWVDFVVAGLALGLSQYSYIVGRFFPVALAVASGVALLPGGTWRAHWRGFLLMGAVAAAVALPQWIQFAVAPYTFVARTQQGAGQFVFGVTDAGPVFLAKLIHQVSMLGVRWANAYGPYSSRPLLNPVLFAGLVIAVGVALRVRSRGHRFALALAGLMLVPDLLSYEGLWPSVHRVVPAAPFLFLLGGVGLAHAWDWLSAQPRLPAWSGSLALVALLVASAERQVDFATRVVPRVWAAEGLEWRNSLVEVAEAAYVAAHRDESILLPTNEYQRAPLAFLLSQYYLRRESGFPPPLEAGDTVTVIAPDDPQRPTTEGLPPGYVPDEWVLLKDGAVYFLPPVEGGVSRADGGEELFASNGAFVGRAFKARWMGFDPEVTLLDFAFENGLGLVGYQTSDFTRGQNLTATLYWRPGRRIRADAQIFVQVLDWQDSVVVGVHDWPLRGTYRISAWVPGQTMPLTYRLALPPALDPGPYRLVAGVVDLTTQGRIPLAEGGELATVATFRIPLPPPPTEPAETVTARFGEAIRLKGYTLTPGEDGLGVELYWEALESPEEDYTIFVHVVDEAGNIVAQSDAQALGGAYPTSVWAAGETVMEERILTMPPGTYEVLVGMYRPDTLERLAASAGGEALVDDVLPLGAVDMP